MRRFIRSTALAAIWASGLVLCFGIDANAADVPTWAQRPTTTTQRLRAGFANPDMHYAPFVFWFWDEPLKPDKVAHMARKTASQGFNPGYAHPRTTGPGVFPKRPLPREQWLSALWFDAFERALKQAEATGTYLGYCDEYMWPSFQLAGRLVRQYPELRAVSLRWQTRDIPGGSTAQLPDCFFTVAAQLLKPPPQSNQALDVPLGKWIWKPQPGQGRHKCHFRKVFNLTQAAQVEAAAARICVDNRYVLYINGKRIGACDNWQDVRTWELSSALRTGTNVIAIEGGGDGGLDALTFGLRIAMNSGRAVDVPSDGSWRVSQKAPPGWRGLEFDDEGWDQPRIIAEDPGAEPWSILDPGSQPHIPATILSDTLRIVSRGDSPEWQAPKQGDWRLYTFYKHTHGGPNYLDERLPKAFIPKAHVPYAHRFGERMGRSVPGVFVDNEGDYGQGLAWSATLDRRYRQKWRRDIRLWMPLMIDTDAEGLFARARWQWFEVVSDIYAETMGSTSDWLAQRDMYCISNLWEESLQWQAQMLGDFFKLTRAYSMPGNDCLGDKAVRVHDFKEVQSVCAFEGRRFMSEVMGAGGWRHFTPRFLKQAANAVTAWGVSHVVPHGVFTNRNLDNAAWTPDWFDENPMFQYFHLWTDFVRRASFVNAHGHAVPHVLLLNPMDTVWALANHRVFHPAAAGGLGSVNRRFGQRVGHINDVYSRTIIELTKHRIEFLITDRHYVRQMQVRDGSLIREPFAFRTVIIPPVDVLPGDVARKLVEFAKAGGAVYALGELPSGSTDAGMDDPQMQSLMTRLTSQPSFNACSGLEELKDEIADRAASLSPQIGFLTGEFDMLQRHLRIGDSDFFWLANNGGAWRDCELLVRDVSGRASIWDCETGNVKPIPSQHTDAGSRVRLCFRPYEAFWLAFEPDRNEQPAGGEQPLAEPIGRIEGPWHVRIHPEVQPNLQHPVDIPHEFLEGSGRQLQLWRRWGLERFSGLVDYTASLDLEAKPFGPCFLDLGTVLYFAEVWVNGRSAGARLWPPHTVEVTDLLKAGPNQVRLRIGNLVNSNYGDLQASGLLGPVVLFRGRPGPARAHLQTDLRGAQPIKLANPTADHSQRGFSIHDVLTDDENGWGAYDHDIGEPISQTAVFETATDIGAPGQETMLVFTIKHNHPSPPGLSLGRFRISATTDPRDAFADGRDNAGDVTADWTAFTPMQVASQNGATMRIQDDGSVLVVAGPLAPDTYTVLCRTEMSVITGLRLEALEHPVLPGAADGQTEGGPGRSPGEGNFVVSFLAVRAGGPDQDQQNHDPSTEPR